MSKINKENLQPPTKNSEQEHPWARRIKEALSHSYKHAHNSVNNPIYPKKKGSTGRDRIKFTVIGDRVIKDFIYCVKLVKYLHKYRKKYFVSPEIQGVTTVEWPKVMNDLKIKYRGLAFCISSSVVVLVNDKFYGGKAELKELVKTKYNFNLSINYYKESEAEFYRFITSSGRPCAYMSIKINEEHVGTLIFMLYSDIVPNTCENFLRLCKEKRGGYSGTPIHRIVKGSWIQGGGYGLKSTDLDCENFIVPFDRRGVLGMANAGRHIDCSTQFFVLLQPAKWMTHWFVAFGQLIEGEKTLEKIEAVPTWYESPNSNIIINDAGIFNMDCHDITINNGANEYIDGHIEDLNALKTLLYETLLERVFIIAHLRQLGEGEQESEGDGSIHDTNRLNQNKEAVQKLQATKGTTSPAHNPAINVAQKSTAHQRHKSFYWAMSQENKDFDVETYEHEFEEKIYEHQSIQSVSINEALAQPRKLFHIPLTDVPYPGERDSDFNLRGFLVGDYCHEGDLPDRNVSPSEKQIHIPSYLIEEAEEEEQSDDLDSDEEKELEKFLDNKMDKMSFAGEVIKDINKGRRRSNIFATMLQVDHITDETLRRFRIESKDMKAREERDKKVSISVPLGVQHHSKIKRRQTGFVHPEDLQKLEMIRKLSMMSERMFADEENEESGEDEDKREVLIVIPEEDEEPSKIKRRQTGFVRKEDLAKMRLLLDEDDGDNDVDGKPRQTKFRSSVSSRLSHSKHIQRRQTAFIRPGALSKILVDNNEDDGDEGGNDEDNIEGAKELSKTSVLERLYKKLLVNSARELPTLKHYKPIYKPPIKNVFLKTQKLHMINSASANVKKEHHNHRVSLIDRPSFADAMNFNPKSVSGKRSIYAIPYDRLEQDQKKESLRAVEYAKTRPALTVSEYKTQNKLYQDVVKRDVQSSNKTISELAKDFENQSKRISIRSTGESPMYSVFEVNHTHHER